MVNGLEPWRWCLAWTRSGSDWIYEQELHLSPGCSVCGLAIVIRLKRSIAASSEQKIFAQVLGAARLPRT